MKIRGNMKTIYGYAKEHGLTLGEIAESIDICPQYFYKLLSNKMPMSAKVKKNLFKVSDGQIDDKMIKATISRCRCCGHPLK
jgi:hypothetical protein